MSIAEKLATIAENERKVYEAGFTAGQKTGGGGNTEEAYNEGYEAGKQAEYDEFWSEYLPKTATQMNYMFCGGGWKDSTFNPPYTLRPSSYTVSMFANTSIQNITLEKVDLTLLTQSESFFAGGTTTSIEIDVPNCKTFSLTFARCNSLSKVIIHNLREDATFSNTFQNCKSLSDLTIYGVIGNNINFSSCLLLTQNSLTNIISCLMDFTGTTTTRTLTLHTEAKERLSDSDKATITQKGWTLA